MRRAIFIRRSDQLWPISGCNRLLGFLTLIIVLVTVGIGSRNLVAAEQPAAPTDDGARGAEPTTVWPRRATIDGWIITVYQPQPERLDGNLLTARAAVSIAKDTKDTNEISEPVFGAEWMSIRLEIDREQRIANASSLTVDRVQFPEGDAGNVDAAIMKERLQQVLVPSELTFDLDDLIATLEQEPSDKTIYQIVPPHILIRTTPTELVPFDGQPRFETAGGVTLAINTPAFVCVESNGAWWLRLDSGWLTAPGSTGPWVVARAPAGVAAAAESAGVKANAAALGEAAAPTVIISTEPTELVVFDGEPQWTPIADTGILAAENCDSDAFIDTATRRYWLLFAGRWFSAERLADDASWIAVAPNALPAGFSAIPTYSRWAHVRVHISGTDEARKAALDAQVPQTARIPRSATITVTYDGDPRFTPIPASDVAWAENSTFAVFRTPGPLYWCCEQGVWYQAAEPIGPWAVATTIPDALHRIPADNPNHNVTYVYVYDSGPDYVWTGYTSGYVHHYIHHGCPVYGSGWYSHGYYGHSGYYCHRPMTWGIRVNFNSWYCGWGIGSSYWRGPVGGVAYVGGHTHSGWWGPTRQLLPTISLTGRRSLSSTASSPRSTVHQRVGIPVTTTQTRVPAIYRQVPGAQVPNRQTRHVPVVDTRVVSRDPGEPVFVRRDGSLIRQGNSGTWQERSNRNWNDLPAAINRDADRSPGAAQRDQLRDQRLPRTATHLPVAQQRAQQQPPGPTRPQSNRPVEPPVIQPVPPTERPTQPPRQEQPRPQLPPSIPANPPTNRPPTPTERPTQPPQQPPRQVEQPRPQLPQSIPANPPTNRPPQQPPRRPSEEPRSQLPNNQPTAPTRPVLPPAPVSQPELPPVMQPRPPQAQPPAPRPEQMPAPRQQPASQPRPDNETQRNDDTRPRETPRRER